MEFWREKKVQCATERVCGNEIAGDAVTQVRNRLDGRCYAIKRIPLNSTKKQLMKKITREVKLLSRLNHENVVRYEIVGHRLLFHYFHQ